MLDMPFELAHRIVALALKFHKVSWQQKNITPSKFVFYHLPKVLWAQHAGCWYFVGFLT